MTRLPSNAFHELAWIVGSPTIGKGTWIGAFTVIDGSGGLEIGAGCDISCGAQIYTHSSARRCVSGRNYNSVDRRPTIIGDRVFIGANAVIQMGVSVGQGSIVAAGSVVTRDVPPNTLVSGVPARPQARIEVQGDRVTYLPLAEG